MTYDPKAHAATLTNTNEPKRRRKKKAADNGKVSNHPPAPSPPKQKAAANDVAPSTTVMIEAPIDSCWPHFATSSVNVKLSKRQAAAAKVLWSSLQKQGGRSHGGYSSHPDGTLVENTPGAIRWLLDRLADAIEAETGKNLIKDFGLTFHTLS